MGRTPREICHEIANALTIAGGMNRTFLDFHVHRKQGDKTENSASVEKLEKIEKAILALERADELVKELRGTFRIEGSAS